MGRNARPEGEGRRREQASKNVRGFARGHGAHHRYRSGHDAPRNFGTGRDRTEENTRQKDFSRLDDRALAELSSQERFSESGRSIEDSGDAAGFGARMEGICARGLVLEVRKGNFLTRLLTDPPPVTSQYPRLPKWKTGDVLRTFVRGTLQQFDLGLSSLVAPGDEIEVIVPPLSGENELHQTGPHAMLTKTAPRRNEFRRLHPSGRAIQTLAANVDRIIMVASAGEPPFRPGFVDRVLVCAMASGIPASLVLNKMDLGLRAEDDELLAVYRGLGIPVFKISVCGPNAPSGDFAALAAALAGTRCVLTGHSGVGKSTLMQALDPALSEERVRTGDVSARTGKGVHTTTHARLFPVRTAAGDAEVIDTPGVREFTPADTDRRNLWGWFPEIARLHGHCSYSNCTHTVEKGCAVLAAVERGEIHPRRHESFVRIYQTLPV